MSISGVAELVLIVLSHRLIKGEHSSIGCSQLIKENLMISCKGHSMAQIYHISGCKFNTQPPLKAASAVDRPKIERYHDWRKFCSGIQVH